MSDPAKPWRIGVAGLGTVGGGLLTLIGERPGFSPVGRDALVTGVSARSRTRPRPVDIANLPLVRRSRGAGRIAGQRPVRRADRRIGRGQPRSRSRRRCGPASRWSRPTRR
ncbi:MAG: hypothetical protein WDM85_07870 [Caulobacteraceae bacterium]